MTKCTLLLSSQYTECTTSLCCLKTCLFDLQMLAWLVPSGCGPERANCMQWGRPQAGCCTPPWLGSPMVATSMLHPQVVKHTELCCLRQMDWSMAALMCLHQVRPLRLHEQGSTLMTPMRPLQWDKPLLAEIGCTMSGTLAGLMIKQAFKPGMTAVMYVLAWSITI